MKRLSITIIGILLFVAGWFVRDFSKKRTDATIAARELNDLQDLQKDSPLQLTFASLPAELSKVVSEATTDFVLATKYKKPKHAKHRMSLSDGGTDIYEGTGYTITIMKRLSSFGDVKGYMYGPVLTFHVAGVKFPDATSHVHFHSVADLDGKLNQNGRIE